MKLRTNIQTLNLLRICLRDIHNLSTGRDVLDIERAIGRAQTVMNTWRSAFVARPNGTSQNRCAVRDGEIGDG